MIRALLTGGILLAAAAPAFASVDVPAKAVWSLTDIDSLQFCAKCNPDDVASTTRVENYKRTIADTVQMGARHILVQAVAGSGRAARVGEFAQALASYNAAAPAGDRACMAVLYADYGTTHTDAEITALYTTAWDSSGTHYCSIGGRPVVATLDDRPDQTCVPSKVGNIITRLRTLASGVAPTAVHWIAAFGERGEYADWQSACRDKVTAAVPVSYSYLEMANDDPAFAADAATRRDVVKAAGGRYILGIPTASAQNCGAFCGDGADSSGYRHTGFGGFARLLSAWRAGADQVAYTFGPGGPYGKDQFVSTAVRCDANDLVTPSADCASVAAIDEPLVPGVPVADGTVVEEPSPPPTGTGVCASSSTPPSPASSIGATQLVFCDDFSTDTVARGTTAAEREINGTTKKWTTEHAIFYSTYIQPAGDFTHDANAGTMRIAPSTNKSQTAMQTVQVRNDQVKGFYVGPWAKYYVETRFKLEKGDGAQPALWTMDMCHWLSRPYTCAEQSSLNEHLEVDFFEYNNGKATVHKWREANAGTVGVATGWADSSTHINCGGPVAGNTMGTFTTYGWQSNNSVATFFKNDVQTGALGPTSCGIPWGLLHKGRFPILIGGKVGDVIVMDYVRVWKAP